jgi:hypothetical protein
VARAAIPVTIISRTGVAPVAETNGDPVNNHTVANDGRTVLLVRNSNGAAVARTLTVRLSGAVDGQGITPRTYSIPAAASRYIGPFGTTEYGTSMQVDVDNAELKLSAYRI